MLRADLEDLVRLTWDRVAVVPVDQRCLDRAGALMRGNRCGSPTRSTSPPPTGCRARCSFVTFDPAQIPVAMSMGFDVAST